jgi:protein-disulfide isomerase
MHKQAFKASEAANCAADQGKFWEMHDLLFANQQTLDVENLVKHAGSLKLNTAKFKQCLDNNKYAERVRSHMNDGQKAGARGTPYFVLATAEPNSTKVKAVKTINGAHPYSAFKSAIEELLASNKQ